MARRRVGSHRTPRTTVSLSANSPGRRIRSRSPSHGARVLRTRLDYHRSPAFSPDGAQIAFVHVPAQKTPPAFFSQRSGRPWSIWTADVKTGQGRRVWIADAGPGSVFHPTRSATNDVPDVDSATNLFWTNHDDLVFPWEKSGWLHLYVVP